MTLEIFYFTIKRLLTVFLLVYRAAVDVDSLEKADPTIRIVSLRNRNGRILHEHRGTYSVPRNAPDNIDVSLNVHYHADGTEPKGHPPCRLFSATEPCICLQILGEFPSSFACLFAAL